MTQTQYFLLLGTVLIAPHIHKRLATIVGFGYTVAAGVLLFAK